MDEECSKKYFKTLKQDKPPIDTHKNYRDMVYPQFMKLNDGL